MISYHKVIKLNAVNSDIKLITRDIDGIKHILLIKGFYPYCFIPENKEYLLEDSQNNVTRIINEGYHNFWNGSAMSTVIFHHPTNIGKERNKIGEKILDQADIHFELACAVLKSIGRYIKIEGNLSNEYIYIDRIQPMTQEEIKDTKFKNYQKLWIDIEVLGEPDVFPNAYDANEQIISIVTNYDEKTIIWFLGSEGTRVNHKLFNLKADVRHFTTENELIEFCYEYSNQCDVGLAWNSKFDEEYLINRSKKLGLTIDWRTIQWFNLQQCVAMAQEFNTNYLALKMIFEDLYMFKRHAWKYLPKVFQDYFSEETGKNVEDRGKGIAILNKESMIYQYIQYRKNQSGGDVKELYESGKHKQLQFYNACDVWDMIMLEKVGTVDSYFNLFDGLELLRLNDLFYHTARIEPLALKFCMANKVTSPSKKYQQGTIKKGAIVHDQKGGKVLENVIVLDFSRFYISIIIAKNVSPENKGDNPQKLFTVMPDGEKLDEPMFFLPALAKYLIDKRNHAETMALKTDDIIIKEYWKSQARSLKTITSGLWGYIAQNGMIYCDKCDHLIDDHHEKCLQCKCVKKPKKKKAGRYYSEHVPNEILQESRNKTMELKEHIETVEIDGVQYEVVYGDTDATFLVSKTKKQSLLIAPEKVAEATNDFFTKLCKDQGYPYPILVKAEKMYDKLVLVSKKFYYGRIVWEDGKFLDTPKYDVKGMQAKRSDHSQLSKDFQYSIIQNHLEDGDKGIIRTIRNMNKRVSQGFKTLNSDFLESISIPWKIRKHIGIKPEKSQKEYYDSGKWKYMGSSAVAWNNYVDRNNLGIDNKITINTKCFIMLIKYCGIKELEVNNQYLVYTQANLIDWSKIEIDIIAMEDKTVKEKIDNIMKSLGWEKSRIKSLSQGKLVQKARF